MSSFFWKATFPKDLEPLGFVFSKWDTRVSMTLKLVPFNLRFKWNKIHFTIVCVVDVKGVNLCTF